MQSEKDKKSERVIEADKICNQADALAGLTHVISMYFVNMKEDEVLLNVFYHLADIALKHKKDCHDFFEKYGIGRWYEINCKMSVIRLQRF